MEITIIDILAHFFIFHKYIPLNTVNTPTLMTITPNKINNLKPNGTSSGTSFSTMSDAEEPNTNVIPINNPMIPKIIYKTEMIFIPVGTLFSFVLTTRQIT